MRNGQWSGGRQVIVALSLLLAGAAAVRAERTIDAAVYLDRLRGMWFGQLIGNHTGRPLEGQYTAREPAPASAFAWVIQMDANDPWTGDDDTSFEYLYLHCLEDCGLAPTAAEIRAAWVDHVPLTDIYIANLQARLLMDHGFEVPATGSYRHNMHAYAIDAQITTESLGALSPGQRQWALETVARFGGVTNEGFSLHAAQFYGAMYALAAFESDVHEVVALGQAAVPVTSRSWQAIQQVRDWYAADLADGTLDWRATRRLIYDRYRGAEAHGRYRGWVESTVNLACTTTALLYGDGDFEETVRIAVLCGFDADCNPATAGGLMGLMVGYDALPVSLTGPATDVYRVLSRPGLPEYDTITGVAGRLQALTEQVIVANGGSVAGGVYHVPDADPVVPPPELPDPDGPVGLVGTLLDAGRNVVVSAGMEQHDPNDDRHHLESIIDGITDLRHNGRVPYDTWDGFNAQPAGGDWYAIDVAVPCRFERLTFYEGDLRWRYVNADPRVHTPRGGYFTSVLVEVWQAGAWRAVSNLALSEPLDPYAYYQVIELDFDPLPGTVVRLRGVAGGSDESTTIVELVVDGVRLGDFDADGDVGLADWAVLAPALAGPDRVPTPEPPIPPAECLAHFDTTLDGDLDLRDFAVFGGAFGR